MTRPAESRFRPHAGIQAAIPRRSDGCESRGFIGIGAERTGTSWIYACLYEHPDTCTSNESDSPVITRRIVPWPIFPPGVQHATPSVPFLGGSEVEPRASIIASYSGLRVKFRVNAARQFLPGGCPYSMTCVTQPESQVAFWEIRNPHQ